MPELFTHLVEASLNMDPKMLVTLGPLARALQFILEDVENYGDPFDNINIAASYKQMGNAGKDFGQFNRSFLAFKGCTMSDEQL